MGSTGTGRFTDYPGKRYNDENGDISAGGGNDIDRCAKAFSAELEEVELCQYFKKNGDVPQVGADVYVDIDQRLCIYEKGSNTSIGYLPTEYNYLAQCIASGYHYRGTVTNSRNSPIAYVRVDIGPDK
jgi:hypothetical protein